MIGKAVDSLSRDQKAVNSCSCDRKQLSTAAHVSGKKIGGKMKAHRTMPLHSYIALIVI
jgi:hypothetical protein